MTIIECPRCGEGDERHPGTNECGLCGHRFEVSNIRVERDLAADAEDHGGWKVTKYHRTGWAVLFRGDFAECHDYAEGAS